MTGVLQTMRQQQSKMEPKTGGAVEATRRLGFNYRHVLLVVMIAWAVRAWFVWYMPPQVRSVDTYSWEDDGIYLDHGFNPYHETSTLNWPPFWMQLIYAITQITKTLHVSFITGLRVFLGLIETLTMVALFGIIRQIGPQVRPSLPILLGVALNPVAILLICQHGNFDVIVGLWVLLFAGQLAQYYREHQELDWLMACLFLGLGILTKTVPLILCPMLAGGLRREIWRTKLLGIALLFGPVTLGMSVIYVLAPEDVTTKVLAYRSTSGWFGFSGLLHLLGRENLVGIVSVLFYILLAGSGAAVAYVFWQREKVEVRGLFLCAALFLAAVPALGPGYSPQYIYWYLPLLVATYCFYGRRWRWLLIGFGVVAAITYVVEYSIVHSHGMYLGWLMERAHYQLTQAGADRLFWWISQPGQMVLRLPLFGAYLVLLGFGVRQLSQDFRMTTPSSDSKSGRRTNPT